VYYVPCIPFLFKFCTFTTYNHIKHITKHARYNIHIQQYIHELKIKGYTVIGKGTVRKARKPYLACSALLLTSMTHTYNGHDVLTTLKTVDKQTTCSTTNTLLLNTNTIHVIHAGGLQPIITWRAVRFSLFVLFKVNNSAVT
jgi:hypothetical protein